MRDVARQTIDAEIDSNGGDLRIDSKEGEAICAIVEDVSSLASLSKRPTSCPRS